MEKDEEGVSSRDFQGRDGACEEGGAEDGG